MTSLFMTFDLGYFVVPLFFLFTSLFLNFNAFYKVNLSSFSKNIVFQALSVFFLSLKPKMFNKISGCLFLSIFCLLFVINFFSVFSFNFPSSSQASSIMLISLGVWLSLILFSLIKNIKGFLFHLIPEGTPLPLTILLFLIELVSNLIRPLTLMIRLVANILAGHLLMILLSALVFNFPLGFMFYVGLNLIELLVALIQAYIFSTMIVLYFSEV